MKKLLNYKWASIGVALLCILLGLCLTVFPSFSLNLICWLLGVLAMIAGVMRVVHYFQDKALTRFSQSELALGLIELLGGLILVINPSGIINLLPVIVGGYIVVESIFSLQTAIEALKLHTKFSWALLLLAVAPLVLGLIMIFFSDGTVSFVTRLLGIALMIWGVAQIWMTASASKMINHFRLNMFDGDQDGRVE